MGTYFILVNGIQSESVFNPSYQEKGANNHGWLVSPMGNSLSGQYIFMNGGRWQFEGDLCVEPAGWINRWVEQIHHRSEVQLDLAFGLYVCWTGVDRIQVSAPKSCALGDRTIDIYGTDRVAVLRARDMLMAGGGTLLDDHGNGAKIINWPLARSKARAFYGRHFGRVRSAWWRFNIRLDTSRNAAWTIWSRFTRGYKEGLAGRNPK